MPHDDAAAAAVGGDGDGVGAAAVGALLQSETPGIAAVAAVAASSAAAAALPYLSAAVVQASSVSVLLQCPVVAAELAVPQSPLAAPNTAVL